VIRGIRNVFLQVSDFERALKFYAALGLKIRRLEAGDNCAAVKLGRTEFMIHEDFDPSLRGARRGAGFTLHFDVSDADDFCAKLRKKGLSPEEPSDRPWGREFSVTDPDGYVLEFIGPRKEKR
jgi:catechol 2,3-dioxygenase-like lactoylglutathione lyase family enzyme